MSFNENTRVKIPAILHLTRLGYTYLSLKDASYDPETNIFTDVFYDSLRSLNEGVSDDEIKRQLDDIKLALDNEDIGRKFVELLNGASDLKLVDYKNPKNNKLHVVTELTYKNGEDEFRPDITLLLNGMPIAFIEVKKPNNHDGVIAERERINVRFKNSKFRSFMNITQILVFTNNMEYDSNDADPIQGAYYSSTSYDEARFNYFREEEKLDLNTLLSEEDEDIENFVLKDNNLATIKHSPEFITNKNPLNPTNRISTSLFSRDRLLFLLRYSLAFVDGENGLEKHIMRYPQIFATKAIERKLDEGVKKGIIWHTQGSGKTALSYYNVHHLTDYFQKQNIIPKFYFIVDRIDLALQAKREFSERGLSVKTISSKEDLVKEFKTNRAVSNLKGKREITVVNIQKFKDDSDILQNSDYDLNIQRVYFLDEVHRSYNPSGSFLANLLASDREAIMIGLTGTPLISKDRKSRDTFGDYIHRYYYNESIADGYTLRLIREGIENNYRIQLENALREIEIHQGDLDKRQIFAHEKFVNPMLDYVTSDFTNSRIRLGDKTIGGMVVCESADQAKALYETLLERNAQADPKDQFSASLILHDVGTKDERKDWVDDFKDGKTDFLFVYNMLLTGFDAKRLKKLYLARVIKSHNLLQTLTRVNRPYRRFRYGYVVDFADISKEFEITNRAYFEELQLELGDEMETYSNLFKSTDEIESEIAQIKESLFHYDLSNSEVFSQQVSEISDRTKVIELKKILANARDLYNIIRGKGEYELLDKLDFKKLQGLYNEVSRHLDLLNLKESLENEVDTSGLLNVALENVLFKFTKVSEEELKLADELKDILKRTRESLGNNFDPEDPAFVSLYDELRRLFKKKNLDEISQDEMNANIQSLQLIFDKAEELNRKNRLLKAKYENDEKYTRIHKRIVERNKPTLAESEIFQALTDIKDKTDDKILLNQNMLENEGYFETQMRQFVATGFDSTKTKLDSEATHYISDILAKEYSREREEMLV